MHANPAFPFAPSPFRLESVNSYLYAQVFARRTGASVSSGANEGTYGDSTHIPQITIGPDGRVILVSTIPIATGSGGVLPARVATTAALPTNVYNNGSSGIGATITIVATGVLTVDGIAVALNDNVLVKNEATQANNGLYTCTVAGAIGVAAVLTRSTSMNTSSQFFDVLVSVGPEGSANPDSIWLCTTLAGATIGTTAITFAQETGRTIPDKTILANVSGATAAPAADTLTAILDDIIGSTRGMGLFRGASTWSALAPASSAGQVIIWNGTDAVWGGGAFALPVIVKSVDQSRNTTTTLADDSELLIALDTGKTYSIRCYLIFNAANSTMRWKAGNAYTGTYSEVNSIFMLSTSSTNNSTSKATTLGPAIPGTVDAGLTYLDLTCTLVTTSAGTYSIQWSQGVSNGSNLTLVAGSYLQVFVH